MVKVNLCLCCELTTTVIDKIPENIETLLSVNITHPYINILWFWKVMKCISTSQHENKRAEEQGLSCGFVYDRVCWVIRHNAIMLHTLRWLYGNVFRAVKQTRGLIYNSIIVKQQEKDAGNNYSTVVWLYMPAMYVHRGNSCTGGIYKDRKSNYCYEWRILKQYSKINVPITLYL